MTMGEMGKASNQSSCGVVGCGGVEGPWGQKGLRPREIGCRERGLERRPRSRCVAPKQRGGLLREKGRVEKAFGWTGQRCVKRSRIKAT